ncbi:hypothetical protein C4J81_01640 [Deltaproteobacteria bacterium Smac51]|nr:hypothetical protein C4J81_01640 [Deltaproteobacteria bacterium Smac51]
MKKNFSILLLSAILFTILAAPASARLVDFGIYIANVPQNWKYTRKDNITTIISPNKECVLIITEGLSVISHKKRVADIVEEHARIIRDHPDQNVTVTRIHGIRIVVTILGDHRERVPLYYSIKLKDESQKVPYR